MFLGSCFDALVSENMGIRSPVQALERELSHIQRDLEENSRQPVETKVLELTGEFYKELLVLTGESSDFSHCAILAAKTLERIDGGILEIHVADV